MDSPKNSARNTPGDVTHYTEWGASIGGLLGLIIGLFIHHWLPLTIGVGVLGLVVGALIDRARKN